MTSEERFSINEDVGRLDVDIGVTKDKINRSHINSIVYLDTAGGSVNNRFSGAKKVFFKKKKKLSNIQKDRENGINKSILNKNKTYYAEIGSNSRGNIVELEEVVQVLLPTIRII